MKIQRGARAVFARKRAIGSVAAGCLIMGLFLSGCATGTGAWSPPEAAAQAGATAPATEDGTWTEAGAVTPAPPAASTDGQQQTPAPVGGTAVAPTATAEAGEAVQFAGRIENLPATGDWSGNWQVAGRLVHVSSTTTIDQRQGQVVVGARVAIQGWTRADNSVDAGWITVLGPNAMPATPVALATPNPLQSTVTPMNVGTPEAEVDKAEEDNNEQGDNQADDGERLSHPIEFRGTVQQLPGSGLVGTWLVSGRTLHVNSHTRIQTNLGPIVTGASVQVKGWQQPDGSINVAWIQSKKAPPAQSNGHQNDGNGNKNRGQNGKGNGNGNAKDKGSDGGD